MTVQGISIGPALVSRLQSRGQPADIINGVVSEWVASIQRHARRAFAQYGEKIREILQPLADHYATSAIILPADVMGIVASLFHRTPCSVSTALLWVRAVPMFDGHVFRVYYL